MSNNLYIGNRYVPKMDGTWDITKNYEPLTVVLWEGVSRTSRKNVPSGTDITNEDFWVVSGNYNQQVENYRLEVKNAVESVEQMLEGQEQNFDLLLAQKTNEINGYVATTKTDVEEYGEEVKADITKTKDEIITLLSDTTFTIDGGIFGQENTTGNKIDGGTF